MLANADRLLQDVDLALSVQKLPVWLHLQLLDEHPRSWAWRINQPLHQLELPPWTQACRMDLLLQLLGRLPMDHPCMLNLLQKLLDAAAWPAVALDPFAVSFH